MVMRNFLLVSVLAFLFGCTVSHKSQMTFEDLANNPTMENAMTYCLQNNCNGRRYRYRSRSATIRVRNSNGKTVTYRVHVR